MYPSTTKMLSSLLKPSPWRTVKGAVSLFVMLSEAVKTAIRAKIAAAPHTSIYALQKWVSETYDDLFLTLSELSVLVNGESDVVGRIRFPELEDRLFLAILKRVANKQVDLAASVSQRSLPERRCSNDQSPWARGCWRGDRPQRFGLLNLPIQIPSWYR
jgi:hypothetical protein